jgi:hypothetical protein
MQLTWLRFCSLRMLFNCLWAWGSSQWFRWASDLGPCVLHLEIRHAVLQIFVVYILTMFREFWARTAPACMLLAVAVDTACRVVGVTRGCAMVFTTRAANIDCRCAVLCDVVVSLAFSAAQGFFLILMNANVFIHYTETVPQNVVGSMNVRDME